MKKSLFAVGTLAFGLFLTACSSDSDKESIFDKISEKVEEAVETKFEAKEVNGLYSVDIPDYMTSTTALHEDASLQYNNPFKERYITVLDETKEDIAAFMTDYGVGDPTKTDLENYSGARYQMLVENGVTISNESSMKKMKINGLNAYMKNIDGAAPGVPEDISYFFTWVEGKDHFYMVTAWTLKSRKAEFEKEAVQMLKSFKEL